MTQIKLVGQVERLTLIRAVERGLIVIDEAAVAVVEKKFDFVMIFTAEEGLPHIVRFCWWIPCLRIPFWRSISRPFSVSSGVPRIGEQWSSTIWNIQLSNLMWPSEMLAERQP